MNPRVVSVTYLDPYQLILTFTDGSKRLFDLVPYLNYPVYDPLKDKALCAAPKIFNGTVVWDESTDFDPDTLYLESKPLLKERIST